MTPKPSRLSVRLAAEDREWLQSRAEGMGVPEATYLSMLIRQCRTQGVEAVMSLNVPGAMERVDRFLDLAEQGADPAEADALVAQRLAEAEQSGLAAATPAMPFEDEPDGSAIVRSLRPAGAVVDERLNISRRRLG